MSDKKTTGSSHELPATGDRQELSARGGRHELPARVLSRFFANLQLIYHSGLPLVEGFQIVLDTASTATEKKILAELREAARTGTPLSTALAKTSVVSRYALGMVRIAEQTGQLDEACGALATYYEDRDRLGLAVRSALVYPLAMLVMVFVVIVLILTAVMPVFSQLFDQLGFQPSGLAQTFIAAGGFLRGAALYVSLVLLAIVAVLLFLWLLPATHRLFSWLYQHLPGFRQLSFNISLQHLTLALSSMLKSGLDPSQALELATEVLGDYRVLKGIAAIRQRVEQEEGFQTAVLESGLLPAGSMALLAVGFKTGADAEVLARISDSLAVDTEYRTASFVAVIEPILVAVMCVLVGIILFSVMLPLLAVLTSF